VSFWPDDISKNDAARITNIDVQMFYDESWKPTYFWVKRSKVKVTTSASVFRLNTILMLAGYASYARFSPAWVSAL